MENEQTYEYYDYKVYVLNLLTNQVFTKYIKNEYFLRQFKNKCKYSKKVRVVGEIKLY
jgi:hypothetical protein